MDVSGEYHATAALSPGRERRYPLYRWLGGPQSGLDNLEKRKIAFLLQGMEIRLVQPVSLVAVQTTLPCPTGLFNRFFEICDTDRASGNINKQTRNWILPQNAMNLTSRGNMRF